MTDATLYIQRLLESNPLREPVLRTLIRSLQLPPGSRGLDAGCGIGLQTPLLLEAVGADGHITGVDVLPELLAHGAARVAQAGLAGHIDFRAGDVAHLPFDDNHFDWVWSADCVGYPAGDFTSALLELLRVTKPGGGLILLGWSSQQFLPGHPLLEARLNGTCSSYLPFLKDKQPEAHFLRTAHRLQLAGVRHITVQTFLGEVQAPLTAALRTALISLFEMLWGAPQPDVSPHDWMLFQRLCRPTSPDFILDLPDYHGFFTYTLFRGVVEKAPASRATKT